MVDSWILLYAVILVIKNNMVKMDMETNTTYSIIQLLVGISSCLFDVLKSISDLKCGYVIKVATTKNSMNMVLVYSLYKDASTKNKQFC